jgi:hypothetical protein
METFRQITFFMQIMTWPIVAMSLFMTYKLYQARKLLRAQADMLTAETEKMIVETKKLQVLQSIDPHAACGVCKAELRGWEVCLCPKCAPKSSKSWIKTENPSPKNSAPLMTNEHHTSHFVDLRDCKSCCVFLCLVVDD